MATISENLQTLQTTKASIKTAIENKGQDLTDVPFTQYASKIDAIQTGGGGGSGDSGGKYLVKVIDYDGTVLKQDRLNTGATFTLPDAPTNHSRLVFQEWSSPVDIVNNEVIVEDDDIIIGAVYTTASGLSEFDIELTKVTGLSATLNMDGTKNWGDGVSDTLTTHTYSNYGKYTITCDGTTMTSSTSTGLLGQTSTTRNYSCINVFLANIDKITTAAFSGCYSLKSVVLPDDGGPAISNPPFKASAIGNAQPKTSAAILILIEEICEKFIILPFSYTADAARPALQPFFKFM